MLDFEEQNRGCITGNKQRSMFSSARGLGSKLWCYSEMSASPEGRGSVFLSSPGILHIDSRQGAISCRGKGDLAQWDPVQGRLKEKV